MWNYPNRYYTCGCIEEYEEGTDGYGDYEYTTKTWCDGHKKDMQELNDEYEAVHTKGRSLREQINDLERREEILLKKIQNPKTLSRKRDLARESEEKHKERLENYRLLLERLEDIKVEIKKYEDNKNT